MKKIVYAYNVENDNVFIGEHVCQTNPKKPGEFLFPSHYTETNPGELTPHKNAFFNVTSKKWEIKSDYRGIAIYNTKTGQQEYCADFQIPEGYTLLPPGKNEMWNGKKWIADSEKIKIAENATAKAELIQIDIQSIRSIREWLVTQPNASEFLKQHESDAKAARAKLTQE